MFRVNNKNTTTRCQICWNLTIKSLERWRQWRRSGVFIVNFEHRTYSTPFFKCFYCWNIFTDVFREYRKRPVAWNVLVLTCVKRRWKNKFWKVTEFSTRSQLSAIMAWFICYRKNWFFMSINQFCPTGLFLDPLKKSDNQKFTNVFRGYRKRQATWNKSHIHWRDAQHLFNSLLVEVPII